MVLHSITASGAKRFEVDALRGKRFSEKILKNMGNKPIFRWKYSAELAIMFGFLMKINAQYLAYLEKRLLFLMIV